jgi:hypothetical protein
MIMKSAVRCEDDRPKQHHIPTLPAFSGPFYLHSLSASRATSLDTPSLSPSALPLPAASHVGIATRYRFHNQTTEHRSSSNIVWKEPLL